VQISRRYLNDAMNKGMKERNEIKVRRFLPMKRSECNRLQKDNKISTIIVSVVGVGQEIVNERGQEGSHQIHSSDFVELILPECVQTLSVATAHQNLC